MYDGIPIAPHLYFTQFLDDTFTTDCMLLALKTEDYAELMATARDIK
jgi:hypothetical protein